MTDAQPLFILVRPQMGENIGAAARAMLNFGLTRMRLVAPRDGWPNPRAVAMASGAGRLLDDAGLYADLPAAIADCDRVYATTARGRDLVKAVLTPEAAMAEARALAAAGARVAVLFGPERTGLENDEIVPANAIVTVPVNPDFPSLNVAQCALLMAYEWHRQGAAAPGEVMHLAGGEMASRGDVARLADHFEERLEAAGYFFPPAKAPHMKANLRNLWSRLPLTRAEVQIFHGILRQIAWKLARQGGDAGETDGTATPPPP
jgi:tRNA/rRNA methyltransferase